MFEGVSEPSWRTPPIFTRSSAATGGSQVAFASMLQALVKRLSRLLITTAVLVVAAPALATQAGAAPVTSQHALVLSVSANPASVPAAGATVTVTGKLKGAVSCALRLLSRQDFPVVYSHNPRDCSKGGFTAQVTIGPSRSPVARSVAFALVASNATSSYSGRFYVVIGAASSASVISANVKPSEVQRSGGTVTVVAAVRFARSCQLLLLSRQGFPVVFSHDARDCTDGRFLAHVTVGANPSEVARTVTFALVARNSVSTATRRVSIVLAAGAGGSTNQVPPVPTGEPASEPSVPLNKSQSGNWSGYAAMGGPYSEASGTFTVPAPQVGQVLGTHVAEWVGLDGTSSQNANLIQAGIDEYPNPRSAKGYSIEAWWEILPAEATIVHTVKVSAGDQVTVTIWRTGTDTWEINLIDDTNGQGFTSPPEHYVGPASSVDWVVEATTTCLDNNRCGTVPLTPFWPPVVFSGLGITGGPQTSLEQITMVQGVAPVSTPSSFNSDGFTVSYTGSSVAL